MGGRRIRMISKRNRKQIRVQVMKNEWNFVIEPIYIDAIVC